MVAVLLLSKKDVCASLRPNYYCNASDGMPSSADTVARMRQHKGADHKPRTQHAAARARTHRQRGGGCGHRTTRTHMHTEARCCPECPGCTPAGTVTCIPYRDNVVTALFTFRSTQGRSWPFPLRYHHDEGHPRAHTSGDTPCQRKPSTQVSPFPQAPSGLKLSRSQDSRPSPELARA